jgi:hypothetical protein
MRRKQQSVFERSYEFLRDLLDEPKVRKHVAADPSVSQQPPKQPTVSSIPAH